MEPITTLRVAYLINLYPAGSHTFIRREIEALERHGVVVQRIALRGWETRLVDEGDKAEQTRTEYVMARGALGLATALLRAVIRSPRRMWNTLRLGWQMSCDSNRPRLVHLAYLAEACVVVELIRDKSASHLHAHFATNPAEIALLARSLGGPPYSFTAHGSDIMDRPAQIGLPHTVRDAAFVVTVCAYGRSQVLKWVPQSLWNRVHVVRCGLQAGYGASAALPSNSSGRLLCIGRLSPEKGQLLLLEAARLLVDRGVRFEIVLAGDGPLRAEVEAMIARSNLQDQVRVTGWLDAMGIRDELDRSAALVVSSLSEGLPVVIMEAMACGRAIVAPYLAGIPELVRTGRSGWLFPAGDIVALADALQACLTVDDLTLREMGRIGRADVWAAHDVDVEAGRLVVLFSHQAKGLGAAALSNNRPSSYPVEPR